MAVDLLNHEDELKIAKELNSLLASKYAQEVVNRVANDVMSTQLNGDRVGDGKVKNDRGSFRATLRSLNPERLIRRALRKRFSKQGTVSKSREAFDCPEYFPLYVQGLNIQYSTGTLVDRRGVGRVAREILKELIRREALATLTVGSACEKPIHFFPSVHWCPSELPPRSVVMVHDVIPLLFEDIFHKSTVGEWKQRYIHTIRNADLIVTVSESSSDDISRIIDIPKEKIHVVYNGVDVLDWEEDKSVDLLTPDAPYFVCIGSNDYHKNIDVVIKAMGYSNADDYHLVVVGKSPKGFSAELTSSSAGKIHPVGRLTDGQLARVLKRSRGLLFPSLYEGFGLPPLEALMLEVPCICSTRPAMTELLPDMVIFCDPDKPQDWANAMHQLANFPPDTNIRSRVASELRRQFNWVRSTDLLLSVLGKLKDAER
ncbi:MULTISPECIES: glycosyltransferase family 4 protein [Rhizobium/Agrobacterium group]|uniref:glycosyltransferase family 4 protein n=1 Tax=Rhizobium/Agrobacterium group TaxID=227290 RepID=UPI0023000B03|nr:MULTISPECIES: glycosyltransferase family 1 protein [Rhizobium/Agrobacterium group]MDA5636427.1 glycosyltransferase family 1 protein [Agrobacterium sp. ST15.16.024]MDF1892260.1 glycosyltransferase family 1 protein [Rhizobium rhizogenes]